MIAIKKANDDINNKKGKDLKKESVNDQYKERSASKGKYLSKHHTNHRDNNKKDFKSYRRKKKKN